MGFFDNNIFGNIGEPIKPPAFSEGSKKESDAGIGSRRGRSNDGGDFMAVPGPDNAFSEEDAEIIGINKELGEIADELTQIDNTDMLTPNDEKRRSTLEHRRDELKTKLGELTGEKTNG